MRLGRRMAIGGAKTKSGAVKLRRRASTTIGRSSRSLRVQGNKKTGFVVNIRPVRL